MEQASRDGGFRVPSHLTSPHTTGTASGHADARLKNKSKLNLPVSGVQARISGAVPGDKFLEAFLERCQRSVTGKSPGFGSAGPRQGHVALLRSFVLDYRFLTGRLFEPVNQLRKLRVL